MLCKMRARSAKKAKIPKIAQAFPALNFSYFGFCMGGTGIEPISNRFTIERLASQPPTRIYS